MSFAARPEMEQELEHRTIGLVHYSTIFQSHRYRSNTYMIIKSPDPALS